MTRFLSGIVLVAAVLSAVWYAPPWLFLAVVEIVVIAAVLEYCGLVSQASLRVPRAAAVTAAAVTAAVVGWPGVPLVPILATVLVAVCLITLGQRQPGPDVPGSAAATAFPVLYIGLPLGLFSAIRADAGREALLFVFLVVVVSDTAQFYVGTWLGRRRLAPAVSPKKSVEGAVAGLVAGAVVTVWLGHVAWPGLGMAGRITAGVLLAATGIAGDLFESLLKRSVGVKDSSALIPGHGGVLDRIDAMLLVVPVYYMLLQSLK